METESRKMQDLGSGTDSHAMGYSGGSCDTNTNCLIFQQIEAPDTVSWCLTPSPVMTGANSPFFTITQINKSL